MRIRTLGTTLVPLALAVLSPSIAEEPTIIDITDDIRMADCRPFGTVFTGGHLLKKPVIENFEGYVQRDAYRGELFSDGFLEASKRGQSKERQAIMEQFFVGAKTCVLSGPAKGEWRIIKSVELRRGPTKDKKGNVKEVDRAFLVFDRPVEIDESLRSKDENIHDGVGLLIEIADPNVGTLGSLSYRNKLSEDQYSFIHDDLPPGTKGRTALRLEPVPSARNWEKKGLCFSRRMHSMQYTDCNREYKLSFWAKAAKPKAKIISAIVGNFAAKETASKDLPSVTTVLSKEWQHYELIFDLTGKYPPSPLDPVCWKSPSVWLSIQAADAAILIDDIEFEGLGYTNPTPWVDEVVNELKKANTDIIRAIGMHRAGVAERLKPRVEQLAYTRHVPTKPTQRMSVSLVTPGVYLPLGEYLQADVWYCLPQAITLDEMDLFMEYLGAPADTGGGKIRAAEGHPKPWLESIPRIHIEFGNEIWNYGGYDQQDYWESLIARAKASPYFRDNLIFHAAGTHFSFARNSEKMTNTPSADRYAIAPYIIHRYPNNIWDVSPEDRARWAIDYGLHQNVLGANACKQYQFALDRGIEHSIYEVNHHLINFEGNKGEFSHTKIPKEYNLINEYVSSKIAGVNVLNNMLLMLAEHQVRDQCFYGFKGQFYNIRLWGGVIRANLTNPRYRPTWLALTAVNKALFGDMLVTTHGGAKPQFTAPVLGRKHKGEKTHDCIWSYAFSDGKKRSLILANVDVTRPLPVQLKGIVAPKAAAQIWQLSGDHFLANNEHENEIPGVTLEESQLSDFADAHTMMLPPASITTIVWETP